MIIQLMKAFECTKHYNWSPTGGLNISATCLHLRQYILEKKNTIYHKHFNLNIIFLKAMSCFNNFILFRLLEPFSNYSHSHAHVYHTCLIKMCHKIRRLPITHLEKFSRNIKSTEKYSVT